MAAWKVLSVKQPWAWAIVQGYQQTENRSWSTRFRGPVLIHASKSRDMAREFKEWQADGDEVELAPGLLLPPVDDLTYGAIVGAVNLVDCVTAQQAELLPVNQGFVDGPFCLVLENAVFFPEPIPAKGSLGFWDCPGELLEQVMVQLRQCGESGRWALE